MERSGYASGMHFSILGPIEVRDGQHLLEIPGRMERGLLGLLIVESGTVVSTDRMIYEIWRDDPPPTALRTLRSHISRLRSALGDTVRLTTRRPGYILETSTSDIDAARFEALAEQARYLVATDASAAAQTAAVALGMWRGSALADLGGFPYAETEARRLEELRLTTFEVHLEAEVRLGHHVEMLPELRSAVSEYPFYERFWALLMLALYRAGRTGDALRTYEDARRALGESLGIEPSVDLRMLERSIVMEDPTLNVATSMPPNNLPAVPSSFVGREEELASLGEVLARSRLVTLTGAGGCGKSRLAIEAAAELLPRFPDGVWVAQLATVRDPAAVPAVVTSALGDPASHAADPLEALVAYLANHRVLLVIDNCEHLLGACAPLLATLLERCPGVRILATSREPIRVPGETIVMVPPLRLPDPDTPPENQETAEAFRLFAERSKEAGGGSVNDQDTLHAITAVCRSLAGLPLAIELAAARTRTLDPRQLAQRVETGLDVLTGAPRTALDRHQTMRAAIDWSYQLLSEEEQKVLRRLSVFRGGWTLDTAERVVGGASPTRIEDVITSLVDRSLVEPVRGGEPRYRLLEPIREFARDKFEASGEFPAIRSKHFDCFLDLAVRGSSGARGADQQVWWQRIDADHDNIRSALRWSLDSGHVAGALRLVAAMGWYWFTRGHWRESWSWFEEAYDAAGAAHPLERAEAAYETASLQIVRVNHEPVMALMQDALEACHRLGDRRGEAWCLHFVALGGLQLGLHDKERSGHRLREAHAIFEELGDAWALAWSMRYLGDLAAEEGDMEGGVDLYLRSIAGFTDLGDRWSSAHSLDNLAKMLLYYENLDGLDRARGYFRRSLREAQEIDDPVWTAHGVLGVAWGTHLAAEPGAIPLLVDAAERLKLVGDENCLSNARAYLGEELERAGDTAGAAASLAEALRLACKLGQTTKVAVNLDRIANIAFAHGETEQARRLLGAVERALGDGSISLPRLYLDDHRALVELAGMTAGDKTNLQDLVPYGLNLAEQLAASG